MIIVHSFRIQQIISATVPPYSVYSVYSVAKRTVAHGL